MSSILKFCPKCSALFSYSKDESGKLLLHCPTCDFTSERDDEDHHIRIKVVKESHSTEVKYALPTVRTTYDQTMLQTTRLDCANEDCPSRDPLQWKPDGTNIPAVSMMNYPDENRHMHMVCRVCNFHWQPVAIATDELS